MAVLSLLRLVRRAETSSLCVGTVARTDCKTLLSPSTTCRRAAEICMRVVCAEGGITNPPPTCLSLTGTGVPRLFTPACCRCKLLASMSIAVRIAVEGMQAGHLRVCRGM